VIDGNALRMLIFVVGLATYLGGWFVSLSDPSMKNYSLGHWAMVIALVLAAPVLVGLLI